MFIVGDWCAVEYDKDLFPRNLLAIDVTLKLFNFVYAGMVVPQ